MSKKSNELLPTPSASMMSEQDFVQAKGNSKTRPKYEDAGFARLLPTPKGSPSGPDYARRGQPQSGADDLVTMMASYSPPVSPANPSQTQDENEVRQMIVTCGRRLSQSLKLSSPTGSFLKTCLESSIWYSPIVKLEWQAKPLYSVLRMTKSAITTQSPDESNQTSDKQGMKQYGLLFQLAVSAHPTEEIECGLLPTARACDSEGGPTKDVQNQNGHWFRENQEGVRWGIKLKDAIAMLPIPKERDWKGQTQRGKYQQNSIADSVIFQDGQKTGMKLQPTFVEWMQGYPIGWTDLNHSETP